MTTNRLILCAAPILMVAACSPEVQEKTPDTPQLGRYVVTASPNGPTLLVDTASGDTWTYQQIHDASDPDVIVDAWVPTDKNSFTEWMKAAHPPQRSPTAP